MGLFNGHLKPGKGVEKNEPKKQGILLYADVIIQKFRKFIGANCLYTLTSTLWILVLYFLTAIIISNSGIVEQIAETIAAADTTVSIDDIRRGTTVMLQALTGMGIFILWGSGPASAAYAYITRCFTAGDPVWVLSDGKDKFIENLKQGFIVIIIDALVLFFSMNAVVYYHSTFTATGSSLWLFLSYGTVTLLALYTMMHPYIYQLMITFEYSIGSIYKNAFLLTCMKLPMNFLLTVISAAVVLLLFNLLNPIAASILLGVFGLCFTRYIPEFYAIRVIERAMIKLTKIEYIDEDAE